MNHIDGDKLNPHLANLEYVTRSGNMRHAFDTGLKTNRGEHNPRTILTEGDVRAIMGEYTGKYGQCAKIARRYGVSHATIQDIIHGRRWTHITAVAA